LWAAATLFAAKGFDHTRISDISVYIDISPPTVLFYFETKARLFTEAVQAHVEATRERFINSKRIYGTSPLQQICDVVHDLGAYRNGLGIVAENMMSDNLTAEFWTRMIVRGVRLFAPTVQFERYLNARIESEQ